MQQKINLFVETSTKENLKFQVYLTDDNKVLLTVFNGELTSVSAVIDKHNINWEFIAQELIDYALTMDNAEYIHDRLRDMGLTKDQLAYLGFEIED